MKHKPAFYEFFAGGGMARAGLGPDWDCVFANDNCEIKAQSYSANWGSDHLVVEDVFKLKASDLPSQADLAWASFPCQDLSLAGLGTGLDGERSGAFWGFWKLVKALNGAGRKPRLIVLENVYGTLTSHGGKDFETLCNSLAQENYKFGAIVVDAVHFLPQSRPRLFVVAVSNSLNVPGGLTLDGPSPAWHPTAIVRAYHRLPGVQKRSWIWWNFPVPRTSVASLEDIVESDPVGVEWHTPEETKRLLQMMSGPHRKKVLAAQSARGMKVGTIYRRTRHGVQRAEVRFDGISGCLRTPTGGSSRQTIIVVDGPRVRTRLLSSREAARLMGLPETYLLPKRYNDAYYLAGDGVAVPVVTHISRFLLKPILRFNARTRTVRKAA